MDRSIILKNATQYNIHGEAASAPLQAMREDHHQILKNYDPKVTGYKTVKDRVTVLFTCNATGIDYYRNTKSWMQVLVWNQYLKKLDIKMRNQGQFDNDEITTEMLSNEEILKAVLPNNQEKEIEESLNPLPLITHSEVDNKVILYLEQQESDFDMKRKN
ncbi:hypothetical protein RhiirA5_407812 [Rhizophagus irregularis]|uniref:Uncharacterized protein n=1 Tax=Rhizophagus irregularis TaxID=588596 RepID=A0A2N0Q9Q1_9GLOM|nr:hypothetical protein RhiirA5_407812 [Rhizophagus irregularis]